MMANTIPMNEISRRKSNKNSTIKVKKREKQGITHDLPQNYFCTELQYFQNYEQDKEIYSNIIADITSIVVGTTNRVYR